MDRRAVVGFMRCVYMYSIMHLAIYSTVLYSMRALLELPAQHSSNKRSSALLYFRKDRAQPVPFCSSRMRALGSCNALRGVAVGQPAIVSRGAGGPTV